MQVNVYHHDFPHSRDALTLVARVQTDETTSPEVACETAWRLTQNLSGSWSRLAVFEDGSANGDYCPWIEVVAPLPVLDGKTYGLRSSMMGDLFEVDGRRFRVAALGFTEEVAS
jgi:hypothetical protein